MARIIHIVIDADVARSAGESVHPVSRTSRETLEWVLSKGHKASMCKKLLTEWRQHRSLYAQRWLTSMFARKKIDIISPQELTSELVHQHIDDEKMKSAALKDSHLIDSALHTDKVITSNDVRARNAFCCLSLSYGELRDIKWFVPKDHSEFVEIFLTENCHTPPEYYLEEIP